MYHVRGTNNINTRAVETTAKASSLNSGDVFLLRNKANLYVWIGKGANTDEVKCAENISKILQGN